MKRLLMFLLMAVLPAYADFGPIAIPPVSSKTISCTSTSGATALPAMGDQQRQVELQNAGSVAIFVEFGASTVASTVAGGYPVLPGQSKVVTIKPDTTHIACIVAATTTTLYVTTGIGQ